ncbi:MAG TPA: pyridoxal-dependent decarboxylase [Blastocatellia bacterium]|nr:pyridoxal-dependent decarboxylase [Blastocatellia bacterium]
MANELNSRLNIPAEEIKRMGSAAVRVIAEYYDSLPSRRVFPETSAREIAERLDATLPEEGEDFDGLLSIFRDVIIEMSRHNGHPRFFGYVASPGTAATAIADLLASALNSSATSWRSAPAATQVERLTIDWIKQIIGYDSRAEGLFVSGGSMANLSALAVARRAKAPADVSTCGAQAIDRAMRIYMSEESHYSITKAAALLGIGTSNVRLVKIDSRLRIDIADLSRKIKEDLAAGHLPFCVVANAGTVGAGAFDPLGAVADAARAHNLWMHVDASYGGFAALAPSAKPFFERIAEADSVALDPHKWLYIPVDCGCVLYRDAAMARATFSQDAEYTRVMLQEEDEKFAFWDYGPELSRRFRALKVWMMLRHAGTQALGEAIERNIQCAKYFERLVSTSKDFEMLAPVELSIFCFRYVPPDLKKELESASGERREEINKQLDALNERIMISLQRDGRSYVSNTRVGGRFALRGCVINYRTTERDMEILLDDTRRIAERIAAE